MKACLHVLLFMVNVNFVCLGNICRSPMAEAVFRNEVEKRGISHLFNIESRATSDYEKGNPVHRGTREKLAENGIGCDGMYSQQINRDDMEKFDYIIIMDAKNRNSIESMFGDKYNHKVYKLLDFAGENRDIADPWYTGNFDETWEDVTKGIEGFFRHLEEKAII